MPDQWGRPQMSDWMGMTQAISSYGAIQDQNRARHDKQGVETAMSFISDQQAEDTPLSDIEKPSAISEQQWAEALVQKHKLAEADYTRWYHEDQQNKAELDKDIARLESERDPNANVPENQRKQNIFEVYNKRVWDNQRYIGTETKEDGSVVHIIENPIKGTKIEQPDRTADEILWALKDYRNRWFDKTAAKARAARIEANKDAILNPYGELVDQNGDKTTIHKLFKTESDANEVYFASRNPDPNAKEEFIEVNIEQRVAQGDKFQPRMTPEESISSQKSKMDIAGKQTDQIRKSMDFIAKQLGVVPDKKKGSSSDDLLALALGEDQGEKSDGTAVDVGGGMPPDSTLRGILGKLEGGKPEEKALAMSWMQMAGELYPGLKNIQKGDQGQGGDNAPGAGGTNLPPNNAGGPSLDDMNGAEIVKAVQAKRAKKEAEAKKRKEANKPVEVHPDYTAPGFGGVNPNRPQPQQGVEMPQAIVDHPRRPVVDNVNPSMFGYGGLTTALPMDQRPQRPPVPPDDINPALQDPAYQKRMDGYNRIANRIGR